MFIKFIFLLVLLIFGLSSEATHSDVQPVVAATTAVDNHQNTVTSDSRLSNVNTCLKAARSVPGNLLNGKTLAGIVEYGWDDLQSIVTKTIFDEEFQTCQSEPTGTFLLPDNVIATPLLQTSLDRMAEFYESFNEFRQTISSSFTASANAKFNLFSASGSFSTRHQESKEKFARYKSKLLRTKLVYRSFNLYRDPVGSLEPGFVDRIEQLCHAVFKNLTYRAPYLAEMIVKDFGTHYVSTADTGAIIEQEIFIDSSHIFTENTTLDGVRASAAASFGSYFGASAEGTHEVTTDSKQTLSKITKHSKIATHGGPNVNSVLALADNGTLLVDNLVSFNHDGDWLYEILVQRNFPLIDRSVLYSAQNLLKNAIELYYRKNTIRGCMDMNAPNYNFEANFDDGTCTFNNDSYPFGGIYQTCVPIKKGVWFWEQDTPEWRCDSFRQDNLYIGKPGCEDALFEPVKLLDEVYGFEDRVEKHVREECETTFLFFENCWDVYYDVIYKDAVKVEAFWCRKKPNVEIPPEKGVMFGGLYDEGKVNEFTGSIGCPGSYQLYHLGRHVTVCLSYQYAQDHAYSVPIEKFFSCQTPDPEKACSTHLNFTQQLASVENNQCDIFYCVKKQSLQHLKHPAIKRPPFMMDQLAADNHSEATVRAIYRGGELFSIPLKLFAKSEIENGRLSNGKINISAYIDKAHKQVLLVSKNLTASIADTLDAIQKLRNTPPIVPSDGGGISGWLICGIVAGIIITIIVVVIAGIVIYQKRRTANLHEPLLGTGNDGV